MARAQPSSCRLRLDLSHPPYPSTPPLPPWVTHRQNRGSHRASSRSSCKRHMTRNGGTGCPCTFMTAAHSCTHCCTSRPGLPSHAMEPADQQYAMRSHTATCANLARIMHACRGCTAWAAPVPPPHWPVHTYLPANQTRAPHPSQGPARRALDHLRKTHEKMGQPQEKKMKPGRPTPKTSQRWSAV